MFRLRPWLVLALVVSALAPAARAGTYGAAPGSGVARVEILPGWREGETQFAALHITLEPGWKTYWRAPGDAGIPPEIDWRGSRNLAGLRMQWPVPHVFEVNGMRSIGYHDEVVLPILLTAARPEAPIELKAKVMLGVCQDVCVPVTVSLKARLQPQGAPDARISAALADRARTAAEAGVRGASCAVEPISDGLRVTARLVLPPQGGAEVVVFEPGDPTIWVSDSENTRSGQTLTAAADLVPPNGAPFALDRSRLRITVIGAGTAVEIAGCDGG